GGRSGRTRVTCVTLNKLLRRRMAALRGAHNPHVLACTFQLLRSGRLALRPLATLLQCHTHIYRGLASCGRSSMASLSSTPLTNLWPSVPPYSLASSMASLRTTRYGVSG